MKYYLSAEEMSVGEVEYISKTENKKKHSDTISQTKNASLFKFPEKSISLILIT